MYKFITIALLSISQSGCGCLWVSEPYGNFISANVPVKLNETIAADTTKQLVTLYPPAKTHFIIAQPANDNYGKSFLTALRTQGYAIAEINSTATIKKSSQPTSTVHYVLDAPESTNLYRITVTIDTTQLTRAYLSKNNTTVPAGAWARME